MAIAEAFFRPGGVYAVLTAHTNLSWMQPGLRLIYREFFSNHYDGFEAHVFEYAAVDEADAQRSWAPEDRCLIDWRPGAPEPDWASLLARVEARAHERLRERAPVPKAKPLPLP